MFVFVGGAFLTRAVSRISSPLSDQVPSLALPRTNTVELAVLDDDHALSPVQFLWIPSVPCVRSLSSFISLRKSVQLTSRYFQDGPSRSSLISPAPAPTNDDIEAVIQMATSARASPDGRTGPPRDTRTQLFVGNVGLRVVHWRTSIHPAFSYLTGYGGKT